MDLFGIGTARADSYRLRIGWRPRGVVALILAAVTAVILSAGCAAPPEVSHDTLVTESNRGVALMGRFDYEGARTVFEDLAEDHPDNPDALVNLAIATLNRQAEGDEALAVEILNRALDLDQSNLRARYCRGLIELHSGQAEAAMADFEAVVAADPGDPDAVYFVGQCMMQLDRAEEALKSYQKAIELDPYLRSAYYRAFQTLQRMERREEAMTTLETFRKLEDNPRARLVEFKYTRMGRRGEVIPLVGTDREPSVRPSGPLFAEAVALDLGVVSWRESFGTDGSGPSLTVCDINGDGLLDLFFSAVGQVGESAENVVAYGRSEGGFATSADQPLAEVSGVNAALWGDIDNDGLTDVYLCRRGPNQLWRAMGKGEFEDITQESSTDGGNRTTVDGSLVDADHDGDLDIFLVNSGGPNELLNNDRNGSFRPLASRWGLGGDNHVSQSVIFSDLDADRDADIIVISSDGPHEVLTNDLLWSYRQAEGWHAFRSADVAAAVAGDFASIEVSGREDDGAALRSNASGIGTRLSVRIGARWTVTDTFRHDSGPGQSLQPISLGLGGTSEIDFIAIEWSDGVYQTEMNLPGGQLHRIAETQRQLSSCPVLFAWDGEKFDFVSDLLGVGGMGFAIGPGEYSQPRPWEHFLMPEGIPAEKDGRMVLKIGEPMEEAAYLDTVRLVAYDVPTGWSVVPDDRMGIMGPAPTGAPLFYQRGIQPFEAIIQRGDTVTETVLNADHLAAPVGTLDHRFIGLLDEEHVLTLRFERSLPDLGNDLALVVDGWIEYPYSQTGFAAWQAGVAFEAPTLEARGGDGVWRMVLEQWGYPAGMPRRMAVPLPPLPAGTTELRLRTNQEIYWDRLEVVVVEPCPGAVRTELPLAEARLERVGFAFRTTGPQHLPHYDYARLAPLWDTRSQEGWYTEFGPVIPLLEAPDGATVIFGPGEEVHLESVAPDDISGGEQRRVFVLELEDWCKDMDLFTKDGDTIDPLPGAERGGDKRAFLIESYNTRFRQGKD